jgi:hypothetical protein
MRNNAITGVDLKIARLAGEQWGVVTLEQFVRGPLTLGDLAPRRERAAAQGSSRCVRRDPAGRACG